MAARVLDGIAICDIGASSGFSNRRDFRFKNPTKTCYLRASLKEIVQLNGLPEL